MASQMIMLMIQNECAFLIFETVCLVISIVCMITLIVHDVKELEGTDV